MQLAATSLYGGIQVSQAFWDQLQEALGSWSLKSTFGQNPAERQEKMAIPQMGKLFEKIGSPRESQNVCNVKRPASYKRSIAQSKKFFINFLFGHSVSSKRGTELYKNNEAWRQICPYMPCRKTACKKSKFPLRWSWDPPAKAGGKPSRSESNYRNLWASENFLNRYMKIQRIFDYLWT